MANAIAVAAVGNDVLPALEGPDGTAEKATCDPNTVSVPPSNTEPVTASCDITYSDDTEWEQTVTITFDMSDNPTSMSTNQGTQIG